MKNKIKINKNFVISENSRPLIVAEISANHCGNKKKSLIIFEVQILMVLI